MPLRTLVTGAAGFTGRYLVRALADRGHEVHALVQEMPANVIESAAAVHQADVTDLPTLERIVSRIEPDHVVHLAAIALVADGNVERMYRTNVFGTRQLLASLADLSRPPASVLLASSANIYGNAHEGLMVETLPAVPANDYGATKAAAELVAGLYRPSLPICVARPFNYTGVGQSRDFLIPKIVDHFRRRADAIRLGNVEVARDFSDVRFVVEAYCRLLSCPEAIGRTVNVSSGTAFRLDEILAKMTELSGHSLAVEVDPTLVRPNEVRKLWGDSSLLDRLVGPIDRIPIETTLQWMLDA